jgi:hypothetical protein
MKFVYNEIGIALDFFKKIIRVTLNWKKIANSLVLTIYIYVVQF